MTHSTQVFWLFILALPIAAISWTITHEDLFAELQTYLRRRREEARSLPQRKFFYLFTCEFCLSHWVTLGVLMVTGFQLLFDDWRGYVVALFSLVWVANHYMSFFARIRLDVKRERVELELSEKANDAPDPAPDAHRDDTPEPFDKKRR